MVLASLFALPAHVRDALLIAVASSALFAFAATAQEARPPADPLIEEVGKSLSPEGIRERQLRAIKALADAYEAEKSARAAERAWWAAWWSAVYPSVGQK